MRGALVEDVDDEGVWGLLLLWLPLDDAELDDWPCCCC